MKYRLIVQRNSLKNNNIQYFRAWKISFLLQERIKSDLVISFGIFFRNNLQNHFPKHHFPTNNGIKCLKMTLPKITTIPKNINMK